VALSSRKSPLRGAGNASRELENRVGLAPFDAMQGPLKTFSTVLEHLVVSTGASKV